MVIGLYGCGGSDTAPPAETPPERCDALLDRYCGHAADCVIQDGVGDPGASAADEKAGCVASLMQGLDCSKAVSVSPNYEACLSSIEAVDCSEYANFQSGSLPILPAVCEGVIRVLE